MEKHLQETQPCLWGYWFLLTKQPVTQQHCPSLAQSIYTETETENIGVIFWVVGKGKMLDCWTLDFR